MIEVLGLSKRYQDTAVVKGISFSAKPGEIVGFLGPNGAGKTTTIRMLATFMPPSSGTATVAGFDIIKNPDEVRRRIGYLPENPPLYSEMTVLEYLRFMAEVKGLARSSIKGKIEEVSERCAITDVQNKLCQHLSRGYKQRVGLAQAIINEPEVIILDEPTSGLDPKQIIQIRETIKSLGEKHTVILSTHILPEVSMVCNKVVIINRGSIVLEDQLSNITKDRSLEDVFLQVVGRDDPATVHSVEAAAV